METSREALIRQLKDRLDEVAEHRAVRWLEELAREPGLRAATDRLAEQFDDVSEELAGRWIRELDERLGWPEYRKAHEDFCYGVDVREPDCQECPTYAECRDEFDANWPDREKSD